MHKRKTTGAAGPVRVFLYFVALLLAYMVFSTIVEGITSTVQKVQQSHERLRQL